MPKHRLILVSLAAGAVAALSGCVVAPVPGYGYDYAPGHRYVTPPPAVVVVPAPYPRYRHWNYRRW
jgi:hypothetical protein